jgi:hypothetical protein
MKRSELKEAIKAEIKSVLSEEIQVGDMVTIGDGKRKYEVINVEKGFMSNIDDVEVKSTDGMPIGSFNPNVGSKTATYKATQLRLAEGDLNEISKEEANAQLEEIEEYQKSIAQLVTQDLKNEPDIDAFIRLVLNDVNRTLTRVKNLKKFKGFQVTFADIREDEEPTKAEVKKEKSIAKEKADALKAQKETKEKIDKIKSVLKKNKSEVLKISKIDRKERTKAEQSLFDNMVDKTKELKKLEKAL